MSRTPVEKLNTPARLRLTFLLACLCAGIVGATAEARPARDAGVGVDLVQEFSAPGSLVELAGIAPHPTKPDLFFVLANKRPAYAAHQNPVLPEEYRGKLLTVNRSGEVVRAQQLVDGDYGGMAAGDGHLFISRLEPAEILKVNPQSGEVVARFPIAGPAGGLEYDAQRNVLFAQLFIGHPHLAVIDARSGETLETLWSDESAMGLAGVRGLLLCTWADGFESDARSELRFLDPRTGRIRGRIALDRVLTSLSPWSDASGEGGAFIGLASASDAAQDRAVIGMYRLSQKTVAWAASLDKDVSAGSD